MNTTDRHYGSRIICVYVTCSQHYNVVLYNLYSLELEGHDPYDTVQ